MGTKPAVQNPAQLIPPRNVSQPVAHSKNTGFVNATPTAVPASVPRSVPATGPATASASVPASVQSSVSASIPPSIPGGPHHGFSGSNYSHQVQQVAAGSLFPLLPPPP